MARCPGCGAGTCTCVIVAADASVSVVPTPSGVTLAAQLAPNQDVGAGGTNMLQKLTGGLFLGSETIGTGGGGSGLVTIGSGNGAGGVESQAGATWRIREDGYTGSPAGYTEPRTILDGATPTIVLPDQGVAAQGRGSATDLSGGSSQWWANLPRSGQDPIVLNAVSGNTAVVPAGQVRTALAVLAIEIGQRLPDPASITYAAKTAAWYIDWGVTVNVGPATAQLIANVIRFEPQPMSRNVQMQVLAGQILLPAGSHMGSVTIAPNTDQLPSSPAITVGVTGWSLSILY